MAYVAVHHEVLPTVIELPFPTRNLQVSVVPHPQELARLCKVQIAAQWFLCTNTSVIHFFPYRPRLPLLEENTLVG